MPEPTEDLAQFLTTAEAGRLCDPPLTPAAIRSATNLGLLRVAARTGTGQRLYRRADVLAYQAKRAERRGAARRSK